MKRIIKIAEDEPMSRNGNATELNTAALIDRQASTSDPIPSKFCTVSVVSCFRNVSDFHIKRAGSISPIPLKTSLVLQDPRSHPRNLIDDLPKMRLNACFVFLLLGLSLCRAIPTEKKELEEKEPEIEQAGEDTDRSKKSVFLMDELPEVPRARGFNIQTPSNLQALNIKQPGGVSETISVQNPQVAQTLNIPRSPKPTQRLHVKSGSGISETINIQNPRPVQSLGIQSPQSPQRFNIKSGSGISETINIQNSQPVQTLSIQGPQSAQTLNIKPGPGISEAISIQGPQPVQAFSIKPASGPSETIRIQGSPSVQTFSIQPNSQAAQTLSIQGQPVQTFSVKPGSQVQSFSIQNGQSANVIMDPHSTNTVQLIHPGQGGFQTNVNIVQHSVKEMDMPVVEKITRTEKIVEPGVVVSEVEKEIVSPVVPVFREQLTLDPQCSCFLLAEPEALTAFFKCPQLRFGKQRIFCAVRSKVLWLSNQ